MKAQASFEFILLFTIIFLAFIGIAAVFAITIGKLSTISDRAEQAAIEAQIKTITASLSATDISVTHTIPNRLETVDTLVAVIADPDNQLIISDKSSNAQLARVFLPKINSVMISDAEGHTLTVVKSGSQLTILLST